MLPGPVVRCQGLTTWFCPVGQTSHCDLSFITPNITIEDEDAATTLAILKKIQQEHRPPKYVEQGLKANVSTLLQKTDNSRCRRLDLRVCVK